MPLQIGKVPIVVPRQKQFGEHVNNHQLEFCRAVAERMGNIILVEDIRGLWECMVNYDVLAGGMPIEARSHNDGFNQEFSKIVEKMFG